MKLVLTRTIQELKHHILFTFSGAVIGVLIAVFFQYSNISSGTSEHFFEFFHPAHVFFSAMATGAIFRIHSGRSYFTCLIVAFFGAIIIGTISDCIFPYISELFLEKIISHEHIHAEAHIGFIEMWWIVNPLALLGGLIGIYTQRSKFPHLFHVFLSTAASLFHVLASITGTIPLIYFVIIILVLFLAVWLPCCTSDIVFPILFCKDRRNAHDCTHEH